MLKIIISLPYLTNLSIKSKNSIVILTFKASNKISSLGHNNHCIPPRFVWMHKRTFEKNHKTIKCNKHAP